jgi:hypothetical protein
LEDLLEYFLCPGQVIDQVVYVSQRLKSFQELITFDGLIKLHDNLEILNCCWIVFQFEASVSHREIDIQVCRQGLQSPQVSLSRSLIVQKAEVGVAEVEIGLAGELGGPWGVA